MRLAVKLAVAAAIVGGLTAGTTGSAQALSAQSCAGGYHGVVIENNGNYTSVCENIV